MFREIILPIFRNSRLCVTVCGIMHPRCCRPVAGNIVGGALYHKASGAQTGPEAPGPVWTGAERMCINITKMIPHR